MRFQRWFLLLAALAVLPAQTPAPSIVGSWMGVLETGGPKLRIALHVSENALGGLEAKMDSLDQGARGIPVAKVAQDGAAVRLELPQLRASYEGTLQENGEITGTWRQGPGSLPLTFRRGEELDFVEDALAGVAFLKSRHEIDASRVGLIGHSEGGIVGAIAASKSDGIAFLVLMAATGVKGAEVLTMQADLMATAAGAPPAAREQSRILQQKLLAIAEQEEDREKVRAKARAELEPLIANAPEGQRQTIERAMDGQISGLTSPWMRFFLRYDPSEALRKVKCPVLAINGEKDLQVSPKQNLPAIRKALEEAGNSDVTVEELPGLNHMFQHADKGLPSEYGSIEETFAPAALNAILDWLEERLRR
ncbi:MAG: alpha/beta hydrolase family protein [Bryobacteraceae bacterium]